MKYNLYDFDGTIYDGDSSLDFIKFCQECDRCHKCGCDIADRFCKEDCEYFIFEENRQNEDQWDQ